MATRAELAAHLPDLVGSDVLQLTDPQSGWPALGTLVVEGQPTDVSLFVAPLTLSHRQRDGVERRFQNPGQARPIVLDPGRRPLLLGVWEDDDLLDVPKPVLVSADPMRRAGHVTRFSIFVSLAALLGAVEKGWAEDVTDTGELMRCFLPPLLPISADADWSEVGIPWPVVQVAVEAAGLPEATPAELPTAVERARRAGTSLVRDARFSRRVTEAYGGLCAMCGLDLQLVEGAHILPASAPGSFDEPWNGLALCANHHTAFDRHLVGIRLDTREIVFHAAALAQVADSPPVRALVEGTYHTLAEPAHPSARPKAEMFERRYEYFAGLYAWLGSPSGAAS